MRLVRRINYELCIEGKVSGSMISTFSKVVIDGDNYHFSTIADITLFVFAVHVFK